MAPKVTKKPVAPKSHAARSLADFLLEKRRAGCPVCALPDTVKEQLREAGKRGIRRAEQVEWLESEFGLKLNSALFNAHHSGRHEQVV
jgi:hypothetical protein